MTSLMLPIILILKAASNTNMKTSRQSIQIHESFRFPHSHPKHWRLLESRPRPTFRFNGCHTQAYLPIILVLIVGHRLSIHKSHPCEPMKNYHDSALWDLQLYQNQLIPTAKSSIQASLKQTLHSCPWKPNMKLVTSADIAKLSVDLMVPKKWTTALLLEASKNFVRNPFAKAQVSLAPYCCRSLFSFSSHFTDRKSVV